MFAKVAVVAALAASIVNAAPFFGLANGTLSPGMSATATRSSGSDSMLLSTGISSRSLNASIPVPTGASSKVVDAAIVLSTSKPISASLIVSSSNAGAATLAAANAVVTSASVASSAAASTASFNPAALAKTLLADPEANDRWNDLFTTVDAAGKRNLLPADQLRQRLVFDFNTAPAAGEGGRILLAHEDNYPILVDQGLATAVAFLAPCGMNAPHVHPRASEFLTVVQGSVTTGMMLENGFLPSPPALTTELTTTLSAFQSTLFPMGSIHYQFNDNCQPATFVATLNSADPGVSQIAQNYFFENDRIVNITLGQPISINGKSIADFRNSLPANLVRAHDQCAKRCGFS